MVNVNNLSIVLAIFLQFAPTHLCTSSSLLNSSSSSRARVSREMASSILHMLQGGKMIIIATL